jgi:cytochrome c5
MVDSRRSNACGIGTLAVAGLLALAGCRPSSEPPADEKTGKLIEPVARLELAGGPAGPAPAPAVAASAKSEQAAPASETPGPAPAAQPEKAATASAAAAPAPAAQAPAGASGKEVYDKACMACHLTGVAGAPKFGDKAAWAPRLAAGVDGLVKSVISGKGAMPPKAGNASLSDGEIKAAVEYMLAQVK